MYEEFYGLKERPFTLVPDPSYLFLGSQHKLARAYLEYGIKERMGFVVLTGEVGTGKTTLIKSLLREKETSQRVGVLYQTSVEAEDLLDVLLKEFEIRGHLGAGRAARLGAFNQFLLNAYARGERVVLLVDEAQNLGAKALEELRLLSNLQTEKEPLLQVILVGQPGLRDRLRHPSLRQLAQRVAIHYHLRPLDEDETKEYIRFRLARAGGSGIFTASALDKLYDYTQGVPRRINAWCDLALVAGFAEGRHEIDGEFIDLVITAQGGSLEDIAGDSSEESSPSSVPGSHFGKSRSRLFWSVQWAASDRVRIVGTVNPLGRVGLGNDQPARSGSDQIHDLAITTPNLSSFRKTPAKPRHPPRKLHFPRKVCPNRAEVGGPGF